MLKSYLVKAADADAVYEWAKGQHFMGRWMPESHELTHVYLGEFFWSPAYDYHNVPFHRHEGWTRGWHEEIPQPVLVTSEQYMWEQAGFDCSVDDTLNIYVPCKLLAEGMHLSWNGREGSWFDPRGELVAFDPSVTEPGPGALLVRQDRLARFLAEHDYDIIWTVLAEKMIHPGPSGRGGIGRLELSGAYRLREGDVDGLLRSKFESFRKG